MIEITDMDPVALFGEHNAHLAQLKDYFPKLKIVGRGNQIIVLGSSEVIDHFEKKVARLIQYYSRYNTLNENIIEQILLDDAPSPTKKEDGSEILVHGSGGKLIKAQTPNQRKLVSAMRKNDLVFAVGPAGTGKTYTGVALAVQALKNKEVRRIILTRPAVEAGENLGFLPGDLKEKLDPYMQPLYDALMDMIPAEKLNTFIEKGVIQIAPLAFMRGRTLDNAFVILDEAQNTTHGQMKMFLTRMGKHAKFIVTGDPGQIDLPTKQKSGLKEAMVTLRTIKGVGIVHLDDKDVIRHKLVKQIIKAYKNIEDND